MQSIINSLAISNNVNPQFLEYVGTMDESETIGKIIYLFNVEDENHPRYQSTIALKRIIN